MSSFGPPNHLGFAGKSAGLALIRRIWLVLLAVAGLLPASAAVVPFGPQTNVPMSTVTGAWGWTIVHQGSYGATVPVGTLFAGVSANDYVMYAAAPAGSATFTVLAAGRASAVRTQTAHNTLTNSNGVGFYYNAYSIGFAPAGAFIEQSTADIHDFDTDPLRLSWHASANGGQNPSLAPTQIFAGWRAGTTIVEDAGWNRFVLVARGAATRPATGITTTGATLNGVASPSDVATTAWFEWGTSPTLAGATSTPAEPMAGGTSEVAFSAALTGLTADTTYYFRAVQSTNTGPGGISSFITGPDIAVEQPAGMALANPATSEVFPDTLVGSPSAPKIFIIRNSGGVDLAGLEISKDGTNPGNFTVSALGSTTVVPGGSTTFSVTFTPNELGTRIAVIHIRSNDPDEDPFDISLSGDGVATVPRPAYSFTNSTSADIYNNFTMGSRFLVMTSCEVEKLGVYDHHQDGIAGDVEVGLWDSAGTLLASATVTGADPLVGTSRYRSIAPVSLTVGGTYVVGALMNDADAVARDAPGFVVDPRIAYVGSRFTSTAGGFVFPDAEYGGPETPDLFGANFLLSSPASSNAVPTDIALDPASIAENNLPDATVGILTATDADAGDSHTFNLVSGDGDTDNDSFTIEGTALKLKPRADFETKPGYAVRINVNDGTANFSKGLSVSITDVAEAPAISNLADLNINEDTPTSPLAFTIGDPDAGASLSVSASSGNPTLVPDGNIVLGGSGPDRTITVAPAANLHGTAVITVRVSDGTHITSDTFTLTVLSVNDAPGFTLSGPGTISVDPNSGIHTESNFATAMVAGPPDESLQTVNFTLTNDNNALFEIQPAIDPDGTLTFTPAPAAEGTAMVTVKARDNGGTGLGGADTSAAQTFTISVASPGLLNGSFEDGYEGWTGTGHQSLQSAAPYAATDGDKHVSFNDTNRTPDAVLSQTFATSPGQSYLLAFDMGVLAYNNSQQRLQVDLTGNSSLASGTFATNRLGNALIRWEGKSFLFTADSTSTTLTFRDVSTASISIDLLLDNVRVIPQSVPMTLVNGSFESGYDGWTLSGNQSVESAPPYVATDGMRMVAFNGTNSLPDGVLSQTFASIPGQSYALTFDAGVLAFNNVPQSMEVTLSGAGTLLTKTVTITGSSGGNLWIPQSFLFVADGTTTTLTFRDQSASSVSIDMLLDNIRVNEVTNTAPVAVADGYAATRDSLLVVPPAGVLGNDSDANSHPLTAVLDAGPVNGSLVLNPDGGFTYQPVTGYIGPDSFTYHASDGISGSNVVTVSLMVSAPAPVSLVNGSFESGFAGWTVSGNQQVESDAPYAATDGTRLVGFNGGNLAPNAVLSQSFATTPGQTYTLAFDAGVLSFITATQTMQVTATGTGSLLSQTIFLTGLGGGTSRWLPQSFTFVANSATTTLTFRDQSASTISLDLLLDNVRVTGIATIMAAAEPGDPSPATSIAISTPAESIGTPSLTGAPGDYTISVTATEPGLYVLERSEDLSTWEQVQGKEFEPGLIEFHDTADSLVLQAPKQKLFYRIGLRPTVPAE